MGAFLQLLDNGQFRIKLLVLLLGEIADGDIRPVSHRALKLAVLSGQYTHEGRFTGAVNPGYNQLFTPLQGKCEVFYNIVLFIIAFGKIGNFLNNAARVGRFGKGRGTFSEGYRESR